MDAAILIGCISHKIADPGKAIVLHIMEFWKVREITSAIPCDLQ